MIWVIWGDLGHLSYLSYLSPFDHLGAPMARYGHFPLVPPRDTRAWEPWGYGPIHGMAWIGLDDPNHPFRVIWVIWGGLV